MHTVRGKRTLWKRMTDVLPPNSQKGIGLIANLEYRGNIYRKMSKNTD